MSDKPFLIHECHGTEKRETTSKDGSHLIMQTKCCICDQWWTSAVMDLKALEHMMEKGELPEPPK